MDSPSLYKDRKNQNSIHRKRRKTHDSPIKVAAKGIYCRDVKVVVPLNSYYATYVVDAGSPEPDYYMSQQCGVIDPQSFSEKLTSCKSCSRLKMTVDCDACAASVCDVCVVSCEQCDKMLCASCCRSSGTTIKCKCKEEEDAENWMRLEDFIALDELESSVMMEKDDMLFPMEVDTAQHRPTRIIPMDSRDHRTERPQSSICFRRSNTVG